MVVGETTGRKGRFSLARSEMRNLDDKLLATAEGRFMVMPEDVHGEIVPMLKMPAEPAEPSEYLDGAAGREYLRRFRTSPYQVSRWRQKWRILLFTGRCGPSTRRARQSSTRRFSGGAFATFQRWTITSQRKAEKGHRRRHRRAQGRAVAGEDDLLHLGYDWGRSRDLSREDCRGRWQDHCRASRHAGCGLDQPVRGPRWPRDWFVEATGFRTGGVRSMRRTL